MKWLPLLESPHQDARPAGVVVDLIVLHAISLPPGCFETEAVEALFLGRLDRASDHPALREVAGLRVSAHFLIDRRGGITQFVRCGRRAWHAGVSCWQGRERCNDFSIGIEMVGDAHTPFTRRQYTECARLCRALMRRYPAIGSDRIVGHSDVAPGRKWDPGAQWDWARFRRSLAQVRRSAPGIWP
ncbi:MAG: 1,6-anhydro-N-acetylmuramyl-L-alanine amidase AmpD [Mariprofundaceae bacterium]